MSGGAAGDLVARAFESMLKECSNKKYNDLQSSIQTYLGAFLSRLFTLLSILDPMPLICWGVRFLVCLFVFIWFCHTWLSLESSFLWCLILYEVVLWNGCRSFVNVTYLMFSVGVVQFPLQHKLRLAVSLLQLFDSPSIFCFLSSSLHLYFGYFRGWGSRGGGVCVWLILCSSYELKSLKLMHALHCPLIFQTVERSSRISVRLRKIHRQFQSKGVLATVRFRFWYSWQIML